MNKDTAKGFESSNDAQFVVKNQDYKKDTKLNREEISGQQQN